MSQGRKARTNPFRVYTHRTHLAGTERRPVHTKRILVHFYVAAGKSSTLDAALKIKVIMSLLYGAQIQAS